MRWRTSRLLRSRFARDGIVSVFACTLICFLFWSVSQREENNRRHVNVYTVHACVCAVECNSLGRLTGWLCSLVISSLINFTFYFRLWKYACVKILLTHAVTKFRRNKSTRAQEYLPHIHCERGNAHTSDTSAGPYFRSECNPEHYSTKSRKSIHTRFLAEWLNVENRLYMGIFVNWLKLDKLIRL